MSSTMTPAMLRVAWAVVGVLIAVNVGVLAVWPSTHRSAGDGASARIASAATTTSVAPATAPEGTDPAAATTVPTQPSASRSKSATATSTPPASAQQGVKPTFDRGNFPFDLSVSPTCAPRLADMTATIRAVPGAYVSMIVAYSDGKSYGTMYAGPVQDDGTFVLEWKVPATAATGVGHVLASGRDPANDRSGTNVVEFTVVEGKGC